MNCETVSSAMVALLDGELGAAERREVEAHLVGCATCARELALLEETRSLVTRHLARAGTASAGDFDSLWRRVEASRDAAAPARVARSERWVGGRGAAASARRVRSRRLGAWLGAGGLAAAAALALVVYGLQPGVRSLDEPRRPEAAPARVADARRPAGADPAPEPEASRPAERLASAKGSAPAAKRPPAAPASKPAAPAAAVPPSEPDASGVALNEPDPPRDLLERPDLFVNYSIVQKLDELQHLEAVMADTPGSGGAG